jgi:hypothetical protein
MSHLPPAPSHLLVSFQFFYTGGKLITGVVDTGGIFIMGVNDTRSNIFSEICIARSEISAKFEANASMTLAVNIRPCQ